MLLDLCLSNCRFSWISGVHILEAHLNCGSGIFDLTFNCCFLKKQFWLSYTLRRSIFELCFCWNINVFPMIFKGSVPSFWFCTSVRTHSTLEDCNQFFLHFSLDNTHIGLALYGTAVVQTRLAISFRCIPLRKIMRPNDYLGINFFFSLPGNAITLVWFNTDRRPCYSFPLWNWWLFLHSTKRLRREN